MNNIYLLIGYHKGVFSLSLYELWKKRSKIISKMVLTKDTRINNKEDILPVPRFRFAPSPTGGLHIGTARTALFNWLAARNMNGKLILRIEDTDIKRSDRKYEQSIINDLRWLGIDWDEFYRQSERINIYKEYAERLLDQGRAYRCFCSVVRLENLKKKLISEGKMLRYDNRCRDLSREKINKNLKEGKNFTIRFKIGKGDIKFKDLIRGEIKFSLEVIGDFIIIKSDGTPSYNFAVVIDDIEMKITYILRGEDHITNTARQILLFNSLGHRIPNYAHISMILGKDGSKLSKRHGATTISEFRKMGYLREAIINYLCILSWCPKDSGEIFDIYDAVKKFAISDISKSPAIFDIDKLNWINGIYIRKKPLDELVKLCIPLLVASNIIEEQQLENDKINLKIKRCVDAFKDKLKVLGEFPDYIKLYFSDKIDGYTDEAIKLLKLKTSYVVLEYFLQKLNNKLSSFKKGIDTDLNEEKSKDIINSVSDYFKKDKIEAKFLYMPLRVSLTGLTYGPELPKVITIFGIEDCIKRVKQTLKYIKSL